MRICSSMFYLLPALVFQSWLLCSAYFLHRYFNPDKELQTHAITCRPSDNVQASSRSWSHDHEEQAQVLSHCTTHAGFSLFPASVISVLLIFVSRKWEEFLRRWMYDHIWLAACTRDALPNILTIWRLPIGNVGIVLWLAGYPILTPLPCIAGLFPVAQPDLLVKKLKNK